MITSICLVSTTHQYFHKHNTTSTSSLFVGLLFEKFCLNMSTCCNMFMCLPYIYRHGLLHGLRSLRVVYPVEAYFNGTLYKQIQLKLNRYTMHSESSILYHLYMKCLNCWIYNQNRKMNESSISDLAAFGSIKIFNEHKTSNKEKNKKGITSYWEYGNVFVRETTTLMHEYLRTRNIFHFYKTPSYIEKQKWI